MSFHREDWKALGDKVVAHVQANPLPYMIVAVFIFGLILGRVSAN